MIVFEDVTRVFAMGALPRAAAVTALDGLTIRLESGRVHAVVGPNGAGKTTMFAILLGFLFPSSGRVTIAGMPPRAYTARHGAGYLPERFRLPSEWSVLSTLIGLARLEGLDRAAARRRAADAIERFGLAGHADKGLGALSRGLLQRVGIAQALLAERELVVLDEPTEGLDPIWRVKFRDVVGELQGEGRSVLIASHDLGEVERLAERIVLLESGRVRETFESTGPASEAHRYLIELQEPLATVAEAFPGAKPVDGRGALYAVLVADASELSERLAALIAAGGRIVGVRPADEPLEERVRRSLSREAEPEG